MSHSLRTLRVLALLAALVLAGCASPPGGGQIHFSSTGSTAVEGRDVTVTVDASPLKAERRDVFLQQAGSQKIAGNVLEKLSAAHIGSDDSPDAIGITVTEFRLRSSSSGLWLGFMAGVDRIGVTVDLKRDGKSVKVFSTDTSTAVAGLVRPGSVERFDRMVNTLAQRIVDGI